MVRRLRPADGARHRAPRHDEPGDARRPLARIPPAGASASRCEKRGHEGRRSRTRPIPAKSGKRPSSGSRSPGRSIPTDRSASASSSSRRTGPARRSRSTSTTAGSSRTRCPACPRPRSKEGLTPLQYMRKYGAFKVDDVAYSKAHEQAVDDQRRRRRSTASRRAGFNTPSRKLEFYSPTLADWGWPEHAIPRYTPGHVYWRDLDRSRERVRPAAELPAADADPHAIAGEVAVRDLAQQSAVDRHRRRREARHRSRAIS